MLLVIQSYLHCLIVFLFELYHSIRCTLAIDLIFSLFPGDGYLCNEMEMTFINIEKYNVFRPIYANINIICNIFEYSFFKAWNAITQCQFQVKRFFSVNLFVSWIFAPWPEWITTYIVPYQIWKLNLYLIFLFIFISICELWHTDQFFENKIRLCSNNKLLLLNILFCLKQLPLEIIFGKLVDFFFT